MEGTNVVDLMLNSGVSVALLVYFIYKDNKFTTQLSVTLETLQKSIESIKTLIEENKER